MAQHAVHGGVRRLDGRRVGAGPSTPRNWGGNCLAEADMAVIGVDLDQNKLAQGALQADPAEIQP